MSCHCFAAPICAEKADKHWGKTNGYQPAASMKFVAYCLRKWGLVAAGQGKGGATFETVLGPDVGTAARRLAVVFHLSLQSP